jgi:pimeloyl-ACP methyl ester carboxylesterase
MCDPGLRDRLADVAAPTTVIWGAADRVVTPAYGRAYADSFTGDVHFALVQAAGHLPHIEQPVAIHALMDPIVARTD